MKRGLVVLMLMGLGALLLGRAMPAWCAGDRKNNIHFSWAFGAITQTAAGPELVSVKRDTVLPGPAQFKLFVQLHEMAYIYIIHRDARGAINMLFPYSLALFDGDYQISKPYHIPPNASRLSSSAPGRETVYLLVSVVRLAPLEAALGAYLSGSAPQKSHLAAPVIDEIYRAKRRYGALVAQEERPIEIAGRRRSLGLDIRSIASDVAARDFYSRTFTVEHR